MIGISVDCYQKILVESSWRKSANWQHDTLHALIFFFKSNPQTASSVNREFSEIIIMGPAQEIAASWSWVWKWKSSSSVVAGARYKIRIYSSKSITLGQNPQFIQKFTIWKSQFSQNSQF